MPSAWGVDHGVVAKIFTPPKVGGLTRVARKITGSKAVNSRAGQALTSPLAVGGGLAAGGGTYTGLRSARPKPPPKF